MNLQIFKVGIGIGSNLGNRRHHIERAVSYVDELLDFTKISSIYETSPVGCSPGSDSFYNLVAVGEYSGDLNLLLDRLLDFEIKEGRNPMHGVNTPRTMDLDILFAGNAIRNTADLTLPHPRMCERLFVLEPLAEIEPDFLIYPHNKTVRECLDDLKARAKDQKCLKIGSL